MNTTIDLQHAWTVTPLEHGSRFAYPQPANARGFFATGFMPCCDIAFDATDYLGIALRVHTQAPNATVHVNVRCLINPAGGNGAVEGGDGHVDHHAAFPIAASGDHDLLVRWQDFDVETANLLAWQFVSAIDVTVEEHESAAASGESNPVLAAYIQRANGIALDCAVKGRAVEAGTDTTYALTATNCLTHAATVQIEQVFEGWESSAARIEPATLTINAGESAPFTVHVPVTERFVPGGREATLIRCTPDGNAALAATLSLTTMRRMPHPYLVHTADGWCEVADRIRQYPKFKPEYQRWHDLADEWTPEPTLAGKEFCYFTDVENPLMACAYLYMVDGDIAYARKVAQFFRYFTDETNGYPARRKGCHQSFVQEGQFFQHLAIPYDVIADAGVLDAADKEAIARTFRLYMNDMDRHILGGEISNWLLAEIVGAFDCALALEDWERADRFLNGHGGIIDQFRYGTLNDGWWHECSIGYNTWVSGLFLHVCHALEPFGLNLADTRFPVPFNTDVNSSYACQSRQSAEPPTWVRKKWGGNLRATLGFKDLFDASLKFLDYRGVMIGINDSDEKKITAEHWTSTYDLAYRYYRDPEYLPIIERQDVADPVFGFGEIPDQNAARTADAVLDADTNVDSTDNAGATKGGTESEAKPAYLRNAYSDNVGIAMLRSQTPDREPREQIQAVLHYGSHGGAHGHFDITDLLSVMRYGRSLYNPENNWWGYRNFMYKWHTQNTLTKNIVNVDDKMQLPADSARTLFYNGRALQAAAIDVTCNWAYPPYCGMDYDDSAGDFAKRLKMNNLSFPVDPSLTYAATSDETEPIRQRRVMAVTDDYIVLFDEVSGKEPHQYETTWQLKGFHGLESTGGETGEPTHTDQYTTVPASDGQMITDCTWRILDGTSRASFTNRFTQAEYEPELRSDRSFYNDPGELSTDVYTAWPKHTTQVVGKTAMYFGWATDYDGYNVPFDWQVLADGKSLANGSLNGWILGRDEAHVSLDGATTLTLRARQHDVANEKGDPVRTPQSLFWGNAELELADGSTVVLADLSHTSRNVDAGHGIGQDYEGGRVTIQGREFAKAIPASTVDRESDGELTWDLSGLDAHGLRVAIGIDAFPGDESQNRSFYAVRAAEPSASARFITVLEPYEANRKVASVDADSDTSVTVTLTDGRVQRLVLDPAEAPTVTLTETLKGKVLRTETAQGN